MNDLELLHEIEKEIEIPSGAPAPAKQNPRPSEHLGTAGSTRFSLPLSVYAKRSHQPAYRAPERDVERRPTGQRPDLA